MAAAFECPSCGAPLKFDPHPGDETVVCSYCNETVIIPKELRVKPARQAVIEQPIPQKSRQSPARGILTFIIIFFVVMFIIGLFSDQTDSPTDTASFDSGSVTSSPLSAVQSATATVEAKATVEALQPMLKMEQGWPASFTENFVDNGHKWLSGDVRDSYISGNRSISSGTYTWNVTTVQSASDFSLPNMPDQQDFYASVDMKLVQMPDDPDADAGMVFRYNDTDQTWYYFSVNTSGQYYLGWYNGSDWSTLIHETDSDAIHPNQSNRLSVGVKGSQFIFLINGQLVDHFIDDNLKSGTIGVGVNLPQASEKASVEFANFTVLSPSTK
jgi:hypothetical protein